MGANKCQLMTIKIKLKCWKMNYMQLKLSDLLGKEVLLMIMKQVITCVLVRSLKLLIRKIAKHYLKQLNRNLVHCVFAENGWIKWITQGNFINFFNIFFL